MKDNLTKEEIKEFWEWCGIKYMKHQGQEGWIRPDIDFAFSSPPAIDLNNLFRYAVPKVLYCRLSYRGREDYVAEVSNIPSQDIDHICGDSVFRVNKDPALALFRAIQEVIKNERR